MGESAFYPLSAPLLSRAVSRPNLGGANLADRSVVRRMIDRLPLKLRDGAETINNWVTNHRHWVIAGSAFFLPIVFRGNPVQVLLGCVVGDLCGGAARPYLMSKMPQVTRRICEIMHLDDVVWMVTAAAVVGVISGFSFIGAACWGFIARPATHITSQRIKSERGEAIP